MSTDKMPHKPTFDDILNQVYVREERIDTYGMHTHASVTIYYTELDQPVSSRPNEITTLVRCHKNAKLGLVNWFLVFMHEASTGYEQMKAVKFSSKKLRENVAADICDEDLDEDERREMLGHIMVMAYRGAQQTIRAKKLFGKDYNLVLKLYDDFDPSEED